jgi:hypothetical protein
MGRRTVARVLVVLASILAFGGILAIWANRQILNTDNWTQTSTELLQRPVIRQQLATFLVDQLYANVDVQGEIGAALPPRLQPLAGPAASGLRELADRAALRALENPRVQGLWADANREAQISLLQVLDGGGPNVSTGQGVVTLHLQRLLEAMAQQLGVGGRLAAAIPPSAANLVVLRSGQLETAQNAVDLLRKLPYILIGGSLLLFGIALGVARDWRRKAVRGYGIGLALAGAAALLARDLLGQALTDELAKTAAVRPALLQGWTISTSLLEQAASAALGYGIAIVIGAWLAGPTRPATAVRRAVAPYARQPAIAYTTLAVLIGLVLWWSPTPATRDVWLALGLIVLAVLGWEALRRVIVAEHPDAVRRGGTMTRMRDGLHQVADWTRRGGAATAAVVREHVPASSAASSAADERLAQLERLGRLRESGVLDADEFAAQKTAILAEEPATEPNGAAAPTASAPER